MDPLGDSFVPDMPVELITVEILATIAERADLDATLAGWSDAMEAADGVGWIRSRLDRA
jgi:hypothetical protein